MSGRSCSGSLAMRLFKLAETVSLLMDAVAALGIAARCPRK